MCMHETKLITLTLRAEGLHGTEMARVASVIKEPGVFSQSRQGDALSTARAAGAAGNTAAARSLSRHVSAVVAVTLLVCAAADAATAANGYGPVLRGRTSFYGGSFDKMNPNNPSYGTLFGNCGYVRPPNTSNNSYTISSPIFSI